MSQATARDLRAPLLALFSLIVGVAAAGRLPAKALQAALVPAPAPARAPAAGHSTMAHSAVAHAAFSAG